MLLSHYDSKKTPEMLMQEVNAPRDADGEVCGGLNQYVGTWCLKNGFSVQIHTSDFELLDLAWEGLSREDQIKKIRSVIKSARIVPALGEKETLRHLHAYIEFLEMGGDLRIYPYLSSALIDSLLARAPLIASVSYSTLYGVGRTKSTGIRTSVLDDIEGTICTHAVVVVGIQNNQEYLVADPYRSTQPISISKEQCVAALAAAQFCCESAVLSVQPNNDKRP